MVYRSRMNLFHSAIFFKKEHTLDIVMQKSVLLIGWWLLVSAFIPPDKKVYWVVMNGSSLTVNGSTNINTFRCDIANYNVPDTLTCVKSSRFGILLPMDGKLNLSIEAFDCHNKMMTSDLRKTLKAKLYPLLTVKFISIKGFPDFKNPAKITGFVDIGLAGVNKRFEINYLFTEDAKSMILLKGDQRIHFSDFNLVPPSKLGGVIKANDELDVEFRLNLKPIG